MIRIAKITPENWRIKLEVSEEQRKWVANTTVLLARAYAYREARSNAVLIYNDDTPVGMALYYDLDHIKKYDLSQILIDERYQGKGYGTKACEIILNILEEDKKYDEVTLCIIEGNDSARRMYEKLGFKFTGEVDEDEVVMSKKFRW